MCARAAIVAVGALALATPIAAFDLRGGFNIMPASLSPAIAQVRAQPALVEPAEPELTAELLQAYVDRQQALREFDGFEVASTEGLSETMLLSYIARQQQAQNFALAAIEQMDTGFRPRLTGAMVAAFAEGYVPTEKRVQHAESERLCLTQALYHEARGESREGQLAVADVIVNRAMSRKYPSTICGVVFQNADKGRYRCQFTFACDGRSDVGTERRAWANAQRLAENTYSKFLSGQQNGVVPRDVLYYHTTAVAPRWSQTFRRVAAIGSHIFYSPN